MKEDVRYHFNTRWKNYSIEDWYPQPGKITSLREQTVKSKLTGTLLNLSTKMCRAFLNHPIQFSTKAWRIDLVKLSPGSIQSTVILGSISSHVDSGEPKPTYHYDKSECPEKLNKKIRTNNYFTTLNANYLFKVRHLTSTLT